MSAKDIRGNYWAFCHYNETIAHRNLVTSRNLKTNQDLNVRSRHSYKKRDLLSCDYGEG